MEPIKEQGPEETQPDLISSYHDDIRTIELEGYEQGVRKARNSLFWAAALLLIWQIISVARSEGDFDIEPFIWLAPFVIGFIILAIWTKHKPYTAIVVGICLFLAHWALVVITNMMYGDGMNIVQALFGGIIIRVIILVNLFRPLKDAKELQRAKEEKKF